MPKNDKKIKINKKSNSTAPVRDSDGKFTSGSKGLKQFNFNWKRFLPVALVVALVGGFLVYRGFAATKLLALPGSDFGNRDCTDIGGTVVRETSGNKRNASVCQLSNGRTMSPVRFAGDNAQSTNQSQYFAETAKLTGSSHNMKICYSIKLVSVSQAAVTMGSYPSGGTAGSGHNQTISASGDYQVVCDPNAHRGNTRIFLRVNSGTIRVSSIAIERTSAAVPTPTPTPTPTPPVTSGRQCNIYLHGAGQWTGGEENWASHNTLHISPEKPVGEPRNFWKYDGPHNFAHDPNSATDTAAYNSLVTYIRGFMDNRGCGPTMIAGGSNGAAFAAKMYCKGQDFGGRVWAYFIDDPVMDNGVLGCSPSRNVTNVMFTHSQELAEDAANMPNFRCGQGRWGWYCEDDTTMPLSTYESHVGSKSVLQRRYHNPAQGGFNYSQHSFWSVGPRWWCDWMRQNTPNNIPHGCSW